MRVTRALPSPPAAAPDKLGSWSPRERLSPSPGSKTGPGVCVKTRKPIRAENERQWRCEVRMETARRDTGGWQAVWPLPTHLPPVSTGPAWRPAALGGTWAVGTTGLPLSAQPKAQVTRRCGRKKLHIYSLSILKACQSQCTDIPL